MKKQVRDWLNKPLPELNVMFENVDQKIGEYQDAYSLSDEKVAKIKLICQTFLTAYSKVTQNRATHKQMNTWFETILHGTPTGDDAPPAPNFQAIVLPSGAMMGLIEDFRAEMFNFKENSVFTEADGKDLMIISGKIEKLDLNEAAPVLKVSSDQSGLVTVTYVKSIFDGIELEWRKEGDTEWLYAEKTSERTASFTPKNVTLPVRIQLRGIYLVKNQHTGKWSLTYSQTIG